VIEGRAWVGTLAIGVLAGSLTAEAQEEAAVWGGRVHPVWWPLIAVAAGIVLLVLVAWGLLYLTPIFLAIIGAVFGLRWLMKVSERRPSDRALEILRQRYARGEISKEEFETMRRDLGEW
jgi:putative membrane protein